MTIPTSPRNLFPVPRACSRLRRFKRQRPNRPKPSDRTPCRTRLSWQIAAEGLKSFQQRALQSAEKARYALHVQNVNELMDRAMRHLRSEGLIGHLSESDFVTRVLKHPVQFGLLAFFLRRLESRGAFLQRRARDSAFCTCGGCCDCGSACKSATISRLLFMLGVSWSHLEIT